MKRRVVITESDVLEAARAGRKQVEHPDGAIVTPLARDAARDRGIRFVQAAARSTAEHSPPSPPRKVAIGSDHGGFALKKDLEPFIVSLGWDVVDVGTKTETQCDYPDFAYAVARSVADGTASLGLMIDGAGPGSAIVCNKVPGIRAVAASSEFVAWNARAHNDCNVLTLGSRVTGTEVCKRIVRVFLETSFEGGRHAARVAKIAEVESRFSRE